MPVAWRRYSSADIGAPVLTPQVGAAVPVFQQVLVTGYGATTPAGWTQEFIDGGATKVAFRPPATARARQYFRIDDSNATYFKVDGLESMSAIGDAAFLSVTYPKHPTGSATPIPWVMYADDRTCLFFTGVQWAENYDGRAIPASAYTPAANELFSSGAFGEVLDMVKPNAWQSAIVRPPYGYFFRDHTLAVNREPCTYDDSDYFLANETTIKEDWNSGGGWDYGDGDHWGTDYRAIHYLTVVAEGVTWDHTTHPNFEAQRLREFSLPTPNPANSKILLTDYPLVTGTPYSNTKRIRAYLRGAMMVGSDLSGVNSFDTTTLSGVSYELIRVLITSASITGVFPAARVVTAPATFVSPFLAGCMAVRTTMPSLR